MYTTQNFRKNLKIEIDGEPFIIVEANHVKPGKGVAFVKTRYKSLISGLMHNKNFRSGDTVGRPDLEEREMEYLYKEEEFYYFMDSENYEQVAIEAHRIEDILPYLKDNLAVTVLFFNNKAINVELPNFVNMVVTQTDPGVKGDTASGGSKPATLETGHTVLVPLYLEQGELIKIDTRTNEYVERVK